MLLQEVIARESRSRLHENNVMLIRRKIQQLSIDDMVDLFALSANNCKSVVDTIYAHPDWNDEQVAEEIYWDN